MGVRDWRSWLEPLDQIRSKQGIEMITHAHWFAWTTRADLPMEWATLGPAPSAEAQPKDVMMVVKEFMSDINLMQPPVLMLSAGASAMLQPLAGPSAWDYREDIDVAAIERLCTKVVNTCPSRASVVPYLKQWVAQPRVPAMPVPTHNHLSVPVQVWANLRPATRLEAILGTHRAGCCYKACGCQAEKTKSGRLGVV